MGNCGVGTQVKYEFLTEQSQVTIQKQTNPNKANFTEYQETFGTKFDYDQETIVQCNIKGHRNQDIVALCLRKTCQNQRTCCGSCLVKNHESHEIIDIEKLIKKEQNDLNQEILTLYNTIKNIIKQGLAQLGQQIKLTQKAKFPQILNLTTLNQYGNYLAENGQDNQKLLSLKRQLELSTKILQEQFAIFSQYYNKESYSLQEQLEIVNSSQDIVSLLQKNEIDLSLEKAEGIIKKYPEHEAGWHYKAQSLFQSNNDDKLFESMRLNNISLSIQENPNNKGLQGQILVRLKKYKEAIQEFDRAIELNKDDKFNFSYRGQCYEELGMIDQAKQDYQKVLQLDPNYEFAQNALDRLSK